MNCKMLIEQYEHAKATWRRGGVAEEGTPLHKSCVVCSFGMFNKQTIVSHKCGNLFHEACAALCASCPLCRGASRQFQIIRLGRIEYHNTKTNIYQIYTKNI